MLQSAASRGGVPADPDGWTMARPQPRRGTPAVRLLDVEPAIGGQLAGDALAEARRGLVVPCLEIAADAWIPSPGVRRAMALLILDGKLLCARDGAGGADLTLVGPGDVLDARRIDHEVRWRAVEPIRMAVLDARFLLAARAWPQLVAGLADVMFASARSQAALAATGKLPRTEERVAAFFAEVAGRWGHVRADGVVVSLPVTHETLGRLVGARRPTVTLALSLLSETGVLRRLGGGRWWMAPAAVIPASDDAQARSGAAQEPVELRSTER